MDNKLRALYLERTTADEVTINNLMKAETIFDANSAKNWGFISNINDYQNLLKMSKLKQVLFDAFGIQMKAMKVVGCVSSARLKISVVRVLISENSLIVFMAQI